MARKQKAPTAMKILSLYGVGVYKIGKRKYNFAGTSRVSTIGVPEEDAVKLLEMRTSAPDLEPIIREAGGEVDIDVAELAVADVEQIIRDRNEAETAAKDAIAAKDAADKANKESADILGKENEDLKAKVSELNLDLVEATKQIESLKAQLLAIPSEKPEEEATTNENTEKPTEVPEKWEDKTYQQKKTWALANGYPKDQDRKAASLEEWYAAL